MYIYRAVRSRGKSLQEGANHLRVLQHPATASRTHAQTANTQPLGQSSSQMPRDKDNSGLGCTSASSWNSAFPGEKFSWVPYRILAM